MDQDPELAVDIIERCGMDRFEDWGLFRLLSADEDCQSARGFALRLTLVANNENLLRNDFTLYRLIEHERPEAVELLGLVVEADAAVRRTITLSNDEALHKFAKQYAELVIEKLAGKVTRKAEQERSGYFSWDDSWCGQDDTDSTERCIFTVVQTALS